MLGVALPACTAGVRARYDVNASGESNNIWLISFVASLRVRCSNRAANKGRINVVTTDYFTEQDGGRVFVSASTSLRTLFMNGQIKLL